MEAGPEGLAADEPTPAAQASDRARSRTTSSLGGLGYQRAPAWLEDLVTGAHTAMEADDGRETGSVQAHSGRG